MSVPHLSADQYAIQWPEPAHAKTDEAPAKAEACEIEFKNGSTQHGDVLHFTGRDDYFIFRPHKGHEHRSQMIAVRLAKVRQLRLTRPIHLTPINDDTVGQPGTLFAPAEVQIYNVEFQDGEITSGETLGHVLLPTGLFLFLQGAGHTALRQFIPNSSIAYVQVGDPIGKVLVEENVVSEEQLKVAVEKQQAMRRLVLGDYLIEEGFITSAQLDAALELQKAKPSLRLGEALIEQGSLTIEALQTALARQRANRGRPLGQILVDMGVVDAETLRKMHARKLGMPFVNLSKFQISEEALKLVPADVARRLNIVPLAVEDGALIFATPHQPENATTSELGLLARMRVVPVIAAGDEIIAKQHEAYGAPGTERIADPASIRFAAGASTPVSDTAVIEHGELLDVTEEVGLESERTLLMIIQRIVSGAIRGGTLDIHIESEGTTRRTRITFRHFDNS
jgi:hypothetical protein